MAELFVYNNGDLIYPKQFSGQSSVYGVKRPTCRFTPYGFLIASGIQGLDLYTRVAKKFGFANTFSDIGDDSEFFVLVRADRQLVFGKKIKASDGTYKLRLRYLPAEKQMGYSLGSNWGYDKAMDALLAMKLSSKELVETYKKSHAHNGDFWIIPIDKIIEELNKRNIGLEHLPEANS